MRTNLRELTWSLLEQTDEILKQSDLYSQFSTHALTKEEEG